MTQTIETTPAPEVVDLEPRSAAVLHVAGQTGDLPALMREAFEVTMEQIARSGAQVAGPPFARYLSWGELIEAEVGFPYIGTLTATDRVHDVSLPGGRAVMTTHVGPYERIGEAWALVQRWIVKEGLEQASAPWERYLTGPDDPGQPVTQIVFPIR